MPAKIPATVVTGFLGAGKTTLIRHMLQNANGKRIALIINEFGDLGVDGDILKGCGEETCTEEDVMELSNGCICCTVADDFIPTMEKLLERENKPDHIVIETSGLALPQPLVRAFNWPGISTKVTVDGVVTVVDGKAVSEGRFAHSVAAVDAARNTFENVSFDLIYARQGQTPEAWRAELNKALALAVDHLSLYQLTIEQGTAFGDRYNAGKLRDLPDDDDAAEMYEITQDVCGQAGLSAYEVSNHARSGAECRHNLIYWRYGDYVGIGPGAHGRITPTDTRCATEAYRQPKAWLDAAERGPGDKLREILTHEDEATELLLMGMRLSEGVSLSRYEALAQRKLKPSALAELLELGMVAQVGDRLIASEKGRFVLNSVLNKLLED